MKTIPANEIEEGLYWAYKMVKSSVKFEMVKVFRWIESGPLQVLTFGIGTPQRIEKFVFFEKAIDRTAYLQEELRKFKYCSPKKEEVETK